jgi:hypothetical protein
MNDTMTDTISEGRSIAAARLLGHSGFRGPFSLTPLSGGKNNQVFRVDLADQSLVLKAYFIHPGDPRDRLGAEFAFSTFAWSHGLRCLPQPLACDNESRLALYAYVPGRKLTPEETTRARVAEAAAFYGRLNALVREPDAARLPAGSEACFRLADHLHCLARRSERLQRIEPSSAVDRDAALFVSHDLSPLCQAVFDATAEQAKELGIALDAELPIADRCLSPSDFGFHNALVTPAGSMTFLDFEYAGWDDPAKTICDFFCQPELPAPPAALGDFAATVARGVSKPDLLRQRYELLLAVYRLKWCCIMLNDFLPAGNQRRQFARAEADETERKAAQLAKARQALALVADTFEARAAA